MTRPCPWCLQPQPLAPSIAGMTWSPAARPFTSAPLCVLSGPGHHHLSASVVGEGRQAPEQPWRRVMATSNEARARAAAEKAAAAASCGDYEGAREWQEIAQMRRRELMADECRCAVAMWAPNVTELVRRDPECPTHGYRRLFAREGGEGRRRNNLQGEH